mgnify:FL=1
MSDNNKNSVLPDVIEPISNAIQQNIPETAKQTDGALSTIVGFFNNVVLYPVKKANLTFRYKLEAFEDDLKEKTKNIPEENLQIPPTMIAGPALEALRYTYDEKELREMYENLLASAMDTRIANQVLPSFVDAIKQMSPLDALILQKFVDLQQLACAGIKFSIQNTNKVYSKAMPTYFSQELADMSDPFIVSTSITNLLRLGLLNIIDGEINGYNYESFKTHPYVQSRVALFNSFGKPFKVDIDKKVVMINDYGKSFAKVCLGKEV